jgi:hypothetical protein
MLKRIAALVISSMQLIVLLALNDVGAPVYDRQISKVLAEFGICTFACTPE